MDSKTMNQSEETDITKMSGDEYMLYKRKVLFEFFDYNNDGVIAYDDFVNYTRSLSKKLNVSDAKLLMEPFDELWKRLTDISGMSESGGLTLNQWLPAIIQLNKTDWYKEVFVPTMTKRLFDTIDRNKDGQISFDEWRKFQNDRGVTDEVSIKSTFSKLDVDGDGWVTREEVINAFYQFGHGRDPTNDYSFIYQVNVR